jgi:hypothetical protein
VAARPLAFLVEWSGGDESGLRRDHPMPREAVPFSLIQRECLVEFPDRHEKIPVRLTREFTRKTPEIRLL